MKKPRRQKPQQQAATKISPRAFQKYPLSIDPIVDTDAPPSRNLPLSELDDTECHYGTGENERGLILFCGAPQQEKSRYCEHHHSICYRPTRMLTGGGFLKLSPTMKGGTPTFMGSVLDPSDNVTELPHGKSYAEHAGTSA